MHGAPAGEGNALQATGGEAGSQGDARPAGPGAARARARSQRGSLPVSTHSITYSWRCARVVPPITSSPRVIYRSRLKGTAIQMPSADVTVTEHVLGLAPGRYGRSALVDPTSGLIISYSSLVARVRAAAAGLTRRGMRPGDVAGVHVSSPVAFALASQSIRAAGGVPSPAAAGAASGVIAAQLTEGDARILITDTALAGAAPPIAHHSRVLPAV